MGSLKPFVQVACVCEKVLVEPDNVPSLIRVVDTFFLRVPPDLPMPEGVGLEMNAFVALKSGEAIGQFTVGLRLTDPDGHHRPIREFPITLNGGEHGALLRLGFVLAKPKIGLYWFDVLWTDDEVLTRIPFRLKYAPLSDETPEPTATQMH